ncbi:hypothetical protein [Stenotrophomonas phage RAS14]
MATLQEEIELIELDVIGAQKKLDFATEDLKIDGKNLEACCIKHASLLAYYDEIQVQLKYSLNKAKLLELKTKSEIYVYIKENSKRDYTDSAIKIVIDGNPEYIKARELVLMVEEVYDRAVAVVESFRTRSFDLRNIISIRENELQDVIIRA